jgi:hypothetical protein
VKVEVDPDDVDKYQADDRGRINLGIEYGGREVEVAILAVRDEQENQA